jgi:ABC-2 type transport system permease protein
MSVVMALCLREVRRHLRSKILIVGSLGQPLLYLFVLGVAFDPVFKQAGAGSYLQFVGPGIVAMSILGTAMLAGLRLLWDRQFGLFKETFVAPVPRLQIMVGRTLGCATVALIQGTLILVACLLSGLRPRPLLALPTAAVFMVLIAVAFSALGTALGSLVRNLEQFQMVTNFFVLPLVFLSSALFPLASLPPALAIATRINPLSYGVDGMRGALLGVTHFGLLADAAVMSVVAACCVMFGAHRFARLQP